MAGGFLNLIRVFGIATAYVFLGERLQAGRPVDPFLGRGPYAAAQSDRGRHDMLQGWGRRPEFMA